MASDERTPFLAAFVRSYPSPAFVLDAVPLDDGALSPASSRLMAAALTARVDISRNEPERIKADPAVPSDLTAPDRSDDALEEGRTRRWAFAASHSVASYASFSAHTISSLSGSSGADSPVPDVASPLEDEHPFRLDDDPAAPPARTSLYPHVTGSAADRGRTSGMTVRRMLTPLFANEPWTELIEDCDLSSADLYGGAQPCLSDLGPVAQLADLLDYLARACRPPRTREDRKRMTARSFSLRLERLRDRGVEGTLEIVATLSAPEQRTRRASATADGPPEGSVLVVTSSLRLVVSSAEPVPSPRLPLPVSIPPAQRARDLTAFQARIAQTPVGKLIVDLDWSSTPIGAMETWSEGLLWSLSWIMAAPFPFAIWVGRGMQALIYNDACAFVQAAEPRSSLADAAMSAAKHPWILGKRGSVAWSELWEGLEPMALACERGETIYKVDGLLLMEGRNERDPLAPVREEA